MSIKAQATDDLFTLLALGIGGYLALHAIKGWLADMTPSGSAADAVNPASGNNVVNQAAQSAYKSVTGSQGTIGGDIYDFFHPFQYDPTAPAGMQPGEPQVGDDPYSYTSLGS